MPDPYAECINCNYQFFEPDVDDNGLRKKCPECGATGRRYTLKAESGGFKIKGSASLQVSEVADTGTLTESVSVLVTDPPEFEAQFDVEREIDGKTIIQYSPLVNEKLIEFFHKNPEQMKTMDRRLFEEFVAELFSGFGYEVELTKKTRDGGKDIIAISREIVEVKYLIQCKRPDPGKIVGVAPVRELYGVKVSEGATKGILATTAHFSQPAMKWFERHQWELEPREYEDLKEWIRIYLGN